MNEEEIISVFPFLTNAPEEFRKTFLSSVVKKKVPRGAFLAFEEDACMYLPFVIQGSIRVYKMGESGREITLYRIEQGESCVITAFCILNHQNFPAHAAAEMDSEIFLVSSQNFDKWMHQNDLFRNYVFSLFSRRFTSILTSIVEIAFSRMDERLAGVLLRSAEDEVKKTHLELAGELGTAREVVSRILKDFEKEGLITISRGTVQILNREELKKKIHFSSFM